MKVPRWALGVAVAAVVVICADAAVFVVARGGSTTPRAEPLGGRVAVIDEAHGRVVGRVGVGSQPTMIVAGRGSAWVLNKSDGTVSRIDAKSRRVVHTIRLDVPTDDVTLGVDGLWLAGHGNLLSFTPSNPHGTTAVHLLDPATDTVRRTLQIEAGAIQLASGAGALWTTGFVGGDVRGGTRSDPKTGVAQRLGGDVFGDLVAADGSGAYYVTSLGARIQRVDGTGRLVASLPLMRVQDLIAGKVAPNPTGIVIGGGAVWLSQTDGTVLRIDPSLSRIEQKIDACGNAIAVAYGDGAAWTACGEGTAVRIDPATGRAASPIAVGGLPRGIAADAGSVWVSVN